MRCPSSLAANSTGGRKRQRNGGSRLRPHTVLPPSTTPIPGYPYRYNVVPFERGRVVLTLHCRKKKTYSGMKPPYRSDRKYLQDYYLRQTGHEYPVYTGGRFQRGHGLGSLFGGLFKGAMPLLKSGAKTLDREALKTGLSIAGDVVQRKNLKQAAKTRLKTTRQQMLQRALA